MQYKNKAKLFNKITKEVRVLGNADNSIKISKATINCHL